ncbi:hypothetical protein ACWID1_13265, partial [Brevundimonas sp. NPDC055320]
MAMTSPLDASPDPLVTLEPHRKVTLREAFGVDSDMLVPAFETRDSHVPEIDGSYRFDPQTTIAICAGFAYDRRVMVQGYHGTGKSTHIEQVARLRDARQPCAGDRRVLSLRSPDHDRDLRRLR